jgi:hypothetical protein
MKQLKEFFRKLMYRKYPYNIDEIPPRPHAKVPPAKRIIK